MPMIVIVIIDKKNASTFEDLLKNFSDPQKTAFRQRLISVLNSQGEVLPPASSPLGILCGLLKSPDSTLHECGEIIQNDPALTSRLIRIANSAAFGFKSKDIHEALFCLGFEQLRKVVFAAAVLSQLSALSPPSGWQRFWLRSILIARLCERISTEFFPTDGTEYLAGLVHDVGWLFLATHFPQSFGQLTSSELPFVEVERLWLPYTHAEIGAAVSARSSMPMRSVNAVLNHHSPLTEETKLIQHPRESARFLAAILFVCDGAVNSSGLNFFGPETCIRMVQETPEFGWIRSFGKSIDLQTLIDHELPLSEQIYDVFFNP